MNQADQTNQRLEIIWKFVRGDMEAAEFEPWVYAEPGLESELGYTLYLEAISADYSSKREVYEIRTALRYHAEETSDLSCECITLPDVADVDMGEESAFVFKTLEKRVKRGGPFWWLAAYQCTVCEQWWLVAQEERHNDVFILKRLSTEEGEQIRNEHRWPEDFDKYETLLRIGREMGHRVGFIDPLGCSSLSWTAADLASERPGIRVSEVAELLNLEIALAEQIAKRAKREEGVDIDLEQTTSSSRYSDSNPKS